MRQNELDAARAGGQNEESMKFFRSSLQHPCRATLLGMAGLLLLSSCEEKETEAPAEAPAEALHTTPAALIQFLSGKIIPSAPQEYKERRE